MASLIPVRPNGRAKSACPSWACGRANQLELPFGGAQAPLRDARVAHAIKIKDLARIFGVRVSQLALAERQLSAREKLTLIAALDAIMPHLRRCHAMLHRLARAYPCREVRP